MAGNPANASLWTEADVFVGPTTATNPATIDDPFAGDWDLVGLLDGDAGFGYQRTQDENDFFAWGQVLVRTSRRNFKQTVTFTALEWNDVTRDLIWPGSDEEGLFVPQPVRIKLALEKREGDVVRRLITTFEAEVTAQDYTENESALTTYPLTATIYPDGEGQLFDVQETEVSSS